MFCKEKYDLRAAALWGAIWGGAIWGGALFAIAPLCEAQIYVGVNWQKNFVTNTINLGEDAYWNRKIKECYADSLKSIYEQYSNNPLEKRWFLLGLPHDFFNVLLQCTSSDLYNKSSDDREVSATIGTYFFRKEAFLVAAEVALGSSSLKIDQKSQVRLFSGDAPKEMQVAPEPNGTITLDESFSVLKTMTQSLFFGGNIILNQRLFLKNCLTADVLFRFGVIVKDRWYVFLILGATANKNKIEVKDESIEADDLVLYYCTNQWVSDASASWKPEPLVPKGDFNAQLLTFAEEKTSIGAVGGVGAEFFVSHKISFRAQCAYAYHPSVTIASVDGLTNIRHCVRGLRISGSFIWRF